MYPVTIIALRSQQAPRSVQDLDFLDQIAYDAAVLRQSLAINAIQKAGNYGFDPVFRGFKYDQQELRLSALYNRARDADFPALPMDLRQDDTWMFNVQHEVNLDQGILAKWQTALFGSWVDHQMDNLLKPLNPRMLNAVTNAQPYNYGGRTEGTWQLASGKLYTGADLRIEGAEGVRERAFLLGPNAGRTLFDNAWQDSRIQKIGLFSEYHLGLNRFNLVFSGRLEFNQAKINAPADAFAQANPTQAISQINPNFSIGATRALGENL
ncbi:MAG TPA: hypothetical protein VJ953_21330 [Saprospiraceae bacterium]|nr:hypothetical protein [Saprospiraceae bacterium]